MHWNKLDRGVSLIKAGVTLVTNPRTMFTYWTMSVMIGYSCKAWLWFIMEVLEQQLLVLKLHAQQPVYHSLVINLSGESECMPEEWVLHPSQSMNSHFPSWLMQ